MSVEQIEATIESMSASERKKFACWFDEHRRELIDEADDFALTGEQQAELLRRKEAFLADPSIAEPWAGTPEKIHQHLHARRAQKTSARRR
jgi:hypothetical protein